MRALQTVSNKTEEYPGQVMVPVRKGFRFNRSALRHGVKTLLRAYSSGALDRRSPEGRLVTKREGCFARHLGFERFGDCPITLQGKIQLVIRLELFLAVFEPPPDSKVGYRDIRTAENSLSRMYTELGLKPTLRDITGDLEALREKYSKPIDVSAVEVSE